MVDGITTSDSFSGGPNTSFNGGLSTIIGFGSGSSTNTGFTGNLSTSTSFIGGPSSLVGFGSGLSTDAGFNGGPGSSAGYGNGLSNAAVFVVEPLALVPVASPMSSEVSGNCNISIAKVYGDEYKSWEML